MSVLLRLRRFERQPDAAKQFLIIVGLGQVADRAAFDRLPAYSLVGKRSDKDHREEATLVCQKALQLEPAQARHSDIEDQT